jgi:hypothetical protein
VDDARLVQKQNRREQGLHDGFHLAKVFRSAVSNVLATYRKDCEKMQRIHVVNSPEPKSKINRT